MLRRCLERDPKRRLRDIWAARLELEQPATEQTAPSAVPAPRRSLMVAWILAAVMTVVAAAVTVIHVRESPPASPLTRFNVFPPEKGSFNTWIGVSPDGQSLGFTASGADGVPRVWVRPIDSLQARVLPGTDGTVTFFWSPDSRYVVFQSSGKLKKIDVSGGPPQTLSDGVGLLLGGSWNADGVIVFGSNNGPILRVSAAGGTSSPVTKLEQGRDEGNHTDPIFLPDGLHFLYLRRSGRAENSGIYVGSIDAKPEQQSLKRIQAADFSFGYAPPRNGSPGRLLFLREESLMAQAFDERRFEVVGEPAPIAEQVGTSITRAYFSVSLNGVLAYRGGSGRSELTWFDRKGHNLGRAGEPGYYEDMALSKEASRVAYSRTSQGGNRQIWTLEAARGINTLLSFRPDGSLTPVWSSDGKYVAFSSARALYVKDAANSGSERPVLQTGMAGKFVNDWSLDGRFLLYTETTTSLDLFALPDPLGTGERKPIPVANSGFNESQGQFSPDGRWVAYASDESSRFEIYVVPFPPGDGRTGKSLVSSAGGLQPRWRADGEELYYLGLDGSVMAVDTQTDPAFQAATPHALFRSPTVARGNTVYRYDVTRDGKKFLMVNVPVGEPSSPVTVVLNWETGLKK
jgi:Tol biopolymer transport system component